MSLPSVRDPAIRGTVLHLDHSHHLIREQTFPLLRPPLLYTIYILSFAIRNSGLVVFPQAFSVFCLCGIQYIWILTIALSLFRSSGIPFLHLPVVFQYIVHLLEVLDMGLQRTFLRELFEVWKSSGGATGARLV